MGAEPLAEERLERVLRKVTLRLMPFLGLLYFVNILDRANIDFARLQMLEDGIIDSWAYGLGAGIFSLGYCLLEVPSNLILSRVGARRWIARILVSWGLISSAMMFVRGPWSFYLLRFLLGCAEAGFFPGIVLYLTYWFPARQRARAVALFMVASPLVWMLGGPVSGALLQFLDQRAGLAGWQWLFLLEGLPAVVLGVVTLVYLPDGPDQASWLTPEERSWLAERLAHEAQEREHHGLSLGAAAMDRRVWHLIALSATIALGISGMGYYFAPLVKDRFGEVSPLQIGWLKAISGTCTLLLMIAVGSHSDRTGERRWHVAVPALLAALGWGLGVWRDVPLVSFVGLVIAQAAMMSTWGPFWSLSTAFLGSRAAAGGIALINAIGNLGAFLGPTIMGWAETRKDFTPGLLAMLFTLVLSATLALGVQPGTARKSSEG
jgi:ACS family tartrate transporter-like MFS transporter